MSVILKKVPNILVSKKCAKSCWVVGEIKKIVQKLLVSLKIIGKTLFLELNFFSKVWAYILYGPQEAVRVMGYVGVGEGTSEKICSCLCAQVGPSQQLGPPQPIPRPPSPLPCPTWASSSAGGPGGKWSPARTQRLRDCTLR